MSKPQIKMSKKNPKLSTLTAKVYVDVKGSFEKACERWFVSNGIGRLKFKCKAWDYLVAIRNKAIAAQLRQLLNLADDVSVNFSRVCGCSCGCSPGFKVRGNQLPQSIRGSQLWVDINNLPEVNEHLVFCKANALLKQQLVADG